MIGKKGTQESRGQRLRRLRKVKGLSLEEVHQKTKIHIRVLKALEDDAVGEMAPAYVRGLLKIYCTHLGANPKDFVEEYIKSEEETPGLPLAKPRINISVIKKQLKLKPIIFVVGLLIFAVAAFKIGKGISIYMASRVKRSPVPAVVSKKLPSPSVVPVITKPRLSIRAKEDCWLLVKSDGKTIFKGVLKKGRSDYWEAEKKIEFSLGNAGEVDVEVNRQPIPPLGRRRQTIKNITITKDGLRVPK